MAFLTSSIGSFPKPPALHEARRRFVDGEIDAGALRQVEDEAMRRIDTLLSHVWMVRAFLKHSDEAADDAELQEIHRALYDYHLAVGAAWREQNAAEYLKLARKKFTRLRTACDEFTRIQPDVSSHTNFQMATASLTAAVTAIDQVLNQVTGVGGGPSAES
jgi:hypothetical protein